MADFKFDRTAFNMQTFEEAEKKNVFDKDVPYVERLREAYYLVSQAYGFSMTDQPRLDRSTFSRRKRND
jgi:uncharacterized damage-inducible protein DinB